MGEAERSAARARAMGSLGDALAQVMRADRRRRVAATGVLSHTHLRAMWLLLREGEATAGDLARAAHLNPATVTAMVDQLQDRGLVERRRHAADRRICLVALTGPGYALVAAEEERTTARLEDLLDGITDDELRAAARVLDRMTGLLDDPGPAATDGSPPEACGAVGPRPTPQPGRSPQPGRTPQPGRRRAGGSGGDGRAW